MAVIVALTPSEIPFQKYLHFRRDFNPVRKSWNWWECE